MSNEYIQKISSEARRYAQELLHENERLRAVAARLESECRRLEHEAAAHDGERQRLLAQLREIEDESRRLSEQYVAVEQQNANLANLYVASYRLHSTLDRSEVLTGIQEIIINLVGSEEIAIFDLDPDGENLTLVSSFGIDQERYARVAVGEGVIGATAASGELFVDAHAAESGAPDSVTACIPLAIEGRVTAVVAVFRLLQQKSGLEAVDRELFDLLATHAAMALHCTSLHARLESIPEVAVEAMEPV